MLMVVVVVVVVGVVVGIVVFSIVEEVDDGAASVGVSSTNHGSSLTGAPSGVSCGGGGGRW